MAPGSHAHEDRGPLELTEAARIEEEEEEDCFESIDKLISQGISVRDVKKLQDAGIYTCNGLMMHTKKSLTGIKVLSEGKVERICQAAENLLSQRSQEGNDLQIKPFARALSRSLPIVTVVHEERPDCGCKATKDTNTSVVTEFDSDLRPLPADVMDNLEPFALLVRLIARAFYSDVGIEKGEIKTGCNSNCGIAVVVLDKLTRYAWISENKLARMLKIKEKTMFVLLEFLEKERFLQRENTERKQVKIDDDTSNAHDRQKFGDNEYDTLSIPPGLYCCLDYSQVYDVVRYRLHLMKESLKDKIDPGNKLEQQIEEYFCRNCKKRYSALDAMHLLSSSGGTLCCEICKHELVAGNDIDGPRKERRKTFADMLARMKVQLRPLEEQLKMLKDLSVPKFGTLKEWREKML